MFATHAHDTAFDFIESLLDRLPRAAFFAKDASLRFVSANDTMLDMCGLRCRADFLGASAKHVFDVRTAARHESADRYVMANRRPLKDQLDHCVRLRGGPVWAVVSRRVVLDREGEVRGVAGVARVLEQSARKHSTYERVGLIVDHLNSSYSMPINLTEMAVRHGMSSSQLERTFVDIFGLTPGRYLTKVRFEAAMDLLRDDRPIVEVAHACGYADQSAFTRRFNAVVGMSPTEYRRSVRGGQRSNAGVLATPTG